MLRTSFSFFHRGPLREHIKSGARHCSVLLVSLMGPCGAVAFGGKRNAGEFQHRRLQVDKLGGRELLLGDLGPSSGLVSSRSWGSSPLPTQIFALYGSCSGMFGPWVRALRRLLQNRQVGRVTDFLMWGLIKTMGQHKENIVIQTQNGPIILINPHMTTLETVERESRNTA